MKISKDLNLTFDVPQEDGPPLRVHSMPIPMSVYEDNARILGAAMLRVYVATDLPALTAARVAPRMITSELRKAAEREPSELGMPSVYDQLLMEVRRRTMVLVPNGVDYRKETDADGRERTVAFATGYDPLLMDEAIRRDVLDDRDIAEVDGAILFFSVAWQFHPKSERELFTGAAARFLPSGSLTSSNSTEFAASLRTSTATATSPRTGSPQPGATPGPQTVVETGPGGERRVSSLPC